MNPSARLQGVLDLLTEIEAVPRPADALVSAYFRARRYIGSKDRAAVATTVYDILRHVGRLNWWLENKGESREQAYEKGEWPRKQLLVYLATVESKSLEQIIVLFSGGK